MLKDEIIIELLFARDERALSAIEEKYSGLMKYTAGNLLSYREDIDECINDVLLSVWEHIPPEKPESLPAYLTVLVRNAAKNCLERKDIDVYETNRSYENRGRAHEL